MPYWRLLQTLVDYMIQLCVLKLSFLFAILSWCSVGSMQDEFMLVGDPLPLIVHDTTWTSVSEQKHHYPGHHCEFIANSLMPFSTGFRRCYWALIASVSTPFCLGRWSKIIFFSTVYSPWIREVNCFHKSASPNTYISTSHASFHCQRVWLFFPGTTQKFKPVHRTALRAVSRYTSLIVSFDLLLSTSA